ncbi:acyltransferase domain-containing protein [Streptomyces sp. NPDC057617]|uniref:acyltransferase domain-containing protein n=1 Tax=Streptomyces sp. NPDC057617 TaxID=3346184 RepID=UPI00368DC0EF
MSLTAHSAVVHRLVVAAPDPAAPDPAAPNSPPSALSTAVSAVLDAFGRSGRMLPVRTVVHVGAPAGDQSLPAGHESLPVRTAPTEGRALRLAHRELLDGTADLALVVGFGSPGPGKITVYAVKRAAEAVADGDAVHGVLHLTDADASTNTGSDDHDTPPAIHPLCHGRDTADPGRHRLLLWSGRDEEDEARVRAELLALLGDEHTETFPHLPTARPGATGPATGPVPVRAAVVTDAGQAAAGVASAKAVTVRSPRPVALLFPGQGSQHAAMAAGLYRHEPVFTAALDAALSHMGPDGPRIREDWLTTGTPHIGIDDVRRAQPLLFAVDYALGRMVLGWGVRPVALLGHSAGELVAATLADVMSLADAAGMVMARVREAVRIPPGGMLAVGASAARVRPYLDHEVALAAVNANQQVMLAGSAPALAAVEARLRADDITVVTVPATSPFHSPAMAPASDALEKEYGAVPFREPALPLYSGYTGTLMSPEDARSPRFWARQVTDTVHFLPALDELLAAEDVLLVEAGPRQTLTAFARRHRAVRLRASAALPLLPAKPGSGESDRRSVLNAAAGLWTEGHELNAQALSRLWTWTDTTGIDTARTDSAIRHVE